MMDNAAILRISTTLLHTHHQQPLQNFLGGAKISSENYGLVTPKSGGEVEKYGQIFTAQSTILTISIVK